MSSVDSGLDILVDAFNTTVASPNAPARAFEWTLLALGTIIQLLTLCLAIFVVIYRSAPALLDRDPIWSLASVVCGMLFFLMSRFGVEIAPHALMRYKWLCWSMEVFVPCTCCAVFYSIVVAREFRFMLVRVHGRGSNTPLWRYVVFWALPFVFVSIPIGTMDIRSSVDSCISGSGSVMSWSIAAVLGLLTVYGFCLLIIGWRLRGSGFKGWHRPIYQGVAQLILAPTTLIWMVAPNSAYSADVINWLEPALAAPIAFFITFSGPAYRYLRRSRPRDYSRTEPLLPLLSTAARGTGSEGCCPSHSTALLQDLQTLAPARRLAAVIANGNTEAVRKQLLADVAFLSSYDDQESAPIHHLVRRRQPELLSFALKLGADANQREAGGITPLHIAVSLGDVEAIALLLDASANVNVLCDGHYTPLGSAVTQGSEQIVHMLLAAGSDPNTAVCPPKKRRSTGTPAKSRRRGSSTCCTSTFPSGVDPMDVATVTRSARVYDPEKSAFHLAVESSRMGTSIVSAMLNAKIPAAVDLPGPYGMLPIHAACLLGFPKTVERLLVGGANVWAVHAPSGRTGLHFSVLSSQNGSHCISEMLTYIKRPPTSHNRSGLDTPSSVASLAPSSTAAPSLAPGGPGGLGEFGGFEKPSAGLVMARAPRSEVDVMSQTSLKTMPHAPVSTVASTGGAPHTLTSKHTSTSHDLLGTETSPAWSHAEPSYPSTGAYERGDDDDYSDDGENIMAAMAIASVDLDFKLPEMELPSTVAGDVSLWMATRARCFADVQDYHGRTALHYAVLKGDLGSTTVLCQGGASAELVDFSNKRKGIQGLSARAYANQLVSVRVSILFVFRVDSSSSVYLHCIRFTCQDHQKSIADGKTGRHPTAASVLNVLNMYSHRTKASSPTAVN